MFALIIAIVSIALIVALLAIGAYLGSDTYAKSSNVAAASRYINEGQQLQTAYLRVKAEGQTAAIPTIQDLAPSYIQQIPSRWTTSEVPLGKLSDPIYWNSTFIQMIDS